MHTGGDIYDLASIVKPGETYNFSVPMIAPWNKGTYGEMWEVGAGSKDDLPVLCLYQRAVAVNMVFSRAAFQSRPPSNYKEK